MQNFFMRTTETDQTVRTRRLISVFAGRTSQGVFFHVEAYICILIKVFFVRYIRDTVRLTIVTQGVGNDPTARMRRLICVLIVRI